MKLTVECEREIDGRWLAEVPELPGVIVYGATADEATVRAQVLALRVLAERLENGEAGPASIGISLPAAALAAGLPARPAAYLRHSYELEGHSSARAARTARLRAPAGPTMCLHTTTVKS